jgi:8-oxo-dGTP pyrophosphatase MutT (NUDIX family)
VTSAADPPPFLRRLLAGLATVDERWLWPRLATRPADVRQSAVLVLFGEGPEGPDLLLIERSPHLRSHAGQPAFPGGAVDPDDDGPVGAALREAAEETGLDPAGVRVLAVLPELWLPPSGYVVVPVLAHWAAPTEVAPVDVREVAAVARVPLAELVDPANRLVIRHPSGWRGPAFRVGGMLVWGFTAALVDGLLELGGWARPWDRTRVEDLPKETWRSATRTRGSASDPLIR